MTAPTPPPKNHKPTLFNGGTRWLIWILLPIITALLGSIVVMVIVALDRAGPPVSIEVVEPLPAAEWCPEETVTINVRYAIRRSGITSIIETFWSSDQQYTIVADDQPIWFIVTDNTKATRAWSVVVPQLPPGKYEYRLAIEQRAAAFTILQFPFTIPVSCP